ncbi:MAG: flagellar export chaperone FliS [Xylophilus ampelinus]
MFSPFNARAAFAYRQSSAEGASPHQLINLLFDGLLVSLRSAQACLVRGDLAAKGEHIGKAVRFLEEGLKGGLNLAEGGELALNLRNLYDYCVRSLTLANLRNDAAPIAEVLGLVETLADGWRGIAQAQPAPVPAAPRALRALGA